MNLSGFDFETSGDLPEYALQPWRVKQGKAWATSLAIIHQTDGNLTREGGLSPDRDMMAAMMEHAIANKQPICGWNVTFDISWLLAYGLEELVFKCAWLDGMLLWKHYFIEPEYDQNRANKKSYKLQEAIDQYMPHLSGYKDEVDFHNPDPEVRRHLHQINIKDTVAALTMTEFMWEELLDDKQRVAARIEAKCLPLIAKANLEGLVVDTVHASNLGRKLIFDAAAALAAVGPHGATEEIVASPTKLAKLLFDDWGLPVMKTNVGKKTGKTSRSTDKEVLHELSLKDERVRHIRNWREALGNKVKFSDNILESVRYNCDGCTHPGAIVFGTYTSRLTYASKQGKNKDERQTGFAIHQEKNDPFYRGAITIPEGYGLLELDAMGQEFRWMAIASGDTTMLGLCLPGEDAHSFMGAQIEHMDYHALMDLIKHEDVAAKPIRKLGKVGNLCVAEGTLVLTDRGVCSIEQVAVDDLVWDGQEFVNHKGVICSGVKCVMSYAGITTTPKHEVLVGGRWETIESAAKYGWAIEPALGEGWASKRRAAIRIMDGISRRAVREIRSAVYSRTMRLWDGTRYQLEVLRDWAVSSVQGVFSEAATPERATSYCGDGHRPTLAEACQRVVSAVQQSERWFVSQLWWSRDRVSVHFGEGSGRLHQTNTTSQDISTSRHRSCRQRWSLRDWKLALGYTQAEPSQQKEARVYDLTDCGPRNRFAANGLIVHNSLQYRTSAARLMSVARVQYDIPMTMPQAERIHRTYQNTYREVPKYWARQIRLVKGLGYAETYAGRRVKVSGNWNGQTKWQLESTSINYPIQGTGGEMKYLALAVLRAYLVKHGIRFLFDMHDGLFFAVPINMARKAAIEMKWLLDNLPYQQAWGFTPPIPLPWEVKIGPSWGQLHAVEK